ncbi:hypothetical protein BC830DRAFT_1166559 [Chytriomyces sp. MP71]|nr:hypothetical protein BC830DRAFT_1166559 [Chytriomyces sp. MP71]
MREPFPISPSSPTKSPNGGVDKLAFLMEAIDMSEFTSASRHSASDPFSDPYSSERYPPMRSRSIGVIRADNTSINKSECSYFDHSCEDITLGMLMSSQLISGNLLTFMPSPQVWKECFFVLVGSKLYLFEPNPQIDTAPTSVLPVVSCTVYQDYDSSWILKVHGTGISPEDEGAVIDRNWTLRCADESVATLWIRFLNESRSGSIDSELEPPFTASSSISTPSWQFPSPRKGRSTSVSRVMQPHRTCSEVSACSDAVSPNGESLDFQRVIIDGVGIPQTPPPMSPPSAPIRTSSNIKYPLTSSNMSEDRERVMRLKHQEYLAMVDRIQREQGERREAEQLAAAQARRVSEEEEMRKVEAAKAAKREEIRARDAARKKSTASNPLLFAGPAMALNPVVFSGR